MYAMSDKETRVLRKKPSDQVRLVHAERVVIVRALEEYERGHDFYKAADAYRIALALVRRPRGKRFQKMGMQEQEFFIKSLEELRKEMESRPILS